MEVGSSSLPGTTLMVHGSRLMVIILNRPPLTVNLSLGGLAQLARAPALQAGGQRFESVILHYALYFEREIFDILTQARL